MASPVHVGDLCAALEGEFDVDHETCEREVLDLLREALAEGVEADAPAAYGAFARGRRGACAHDD